MKTKGGEGTYHHEISGEVGKTGDRLVPRIGKVARVLVLEKWKPKLIVPCQRVTQKSSLGPHGCSSPHPNGVGVVTTKDWDAGRGTKSSTDYHGYFAVLRN